MANANTLTGLIDPIHAALDTVAREKVGYIPACSIDASAEQAALNQPIRSPIVPALTAVSITPGSYAPDTGGIAVSYVDLVITKQYAVPLQWTGDEQVSTRGYQSTIMQNAFMQAFRTLDNMVEADLAAEATANTSRVVGTAGTTPFATANDFSDFASVVRALDDNGVPDDGNRELVLGSAAKQNIFSKQSGLFHANEAGTEDLLRRGILLDVEGLNLHYSAQVPGPVAVGTGASFVIDGTGNTAIGSTVLKVKTGTGTILAGDSITIGSYTYTVTVGRSGAGTFTIAAPGLKAVVADGNTVTIVATHTTNSAFHKSALVLAARQPFMPNGGDAAKDVMSVQSPTSGIVYQIALYAGYRQMHIEVALAWGVKAVKPEFIVGLLG